MKEVVIYDRALCCSTGVCGPEVDPELPRFAADLDWLKQQGVAVKRYNLAHDAAQFSKNAEVQQLLETSGVDCLPLVFVDGQVMSKQVYPLRDQFALWTGIQEASAANAEAESCCGPSGCC